MHSFKWKILAQNLKQIAICPCPLDSYGKWSFLNQQQTSYFWKKEKKKKKESNAWSLFSPHPLQPPHPPLFDYFEVPGFFWSSDCGKLSKYRDSTTMESFAVPIVLL